MKKDSLIYKIDSRWGGDRIYPLFEKYHIAFVGIEEDERTTGAFNAIQRNIKENNPVFFGVADGFQIKAVARVLRYCGKLGEFIKEQGIDDEELRKYDHSHTRCFTLDFHKMSEEIRYGVIARLCAIGQEDVKEKLSKEYNRIMESKSIKKTIDLLEQKKQIILQGAPGTGKTYQSAEIAVKLIGEVGQDESDRGKIMAKYKEACDNGQIVFTTFHQSIDYEEFVEGIRAQTNDDKLTYEVESGMFRKVCERARQSTTLPTGRREKKQEFDEKYQKFIDEISEGDNEPVELKTPTRKKPFFVELNNRGDGLTLYTTEAKNRQGSLRRAVSCELACGLPLSVPGWKWYHAGILDKIGIKPLQSTSDIPADNAVPKYVLIIDEINRGNVSKILGELITLLEPDKRSGAENAISVQLPYSRDSFEVPSNLYIIGTMNTADRSIGYIDYAVRRRFAFVSLVAQRDVIEKYGKSDAETKQAALSLFERVEKIVTKENLIDLEPEDMMIGHSYFLANNMKQLKMQLEYEIKPLLLEYIKDGILNVKKDKIDGLLV